MSPSVPLLCGRCGAPLGSARRGERCSYCNAIQADARASQAELAVAVRNVLFEDRDRDGVPDLLARPALRPVAPASTPQPRQGALVAALVAMGVVVALIGAMSIALLGRPTKAPSARPTSTVTVLTPSASTVPSAAPSPIKVEHLPTAIPTSPSSKPAAKLTNEQFGRNVVAAQHKKLQACVEQDLLRNPNAPTAYTVTVHVERDGLPRNSDTTFSPTPTSGFQQCAKFVIFYGFSGYGRNAPELVDFTFTTSFAFPNAKPAAKADSTWQ